MDSMSLKFKVKPIKFEQINSQFTRMRCYVMALGKNRNYSHFSKESVDAALYSLTWIPVVAHLQKADDGSYYVGAHDRQIIIDSKDITVKDLTVPFGVVPESKNLEYVDVVESSGVVNTYLAIDVIMWTGRYPELLEAKYSDDIYFNQSMEIFYSEAEPLKEDKRYTDIKKFEFSALTLLGKSDDDLYNSEPCFPSAHVEPIKYDLSSDMFKTEFSLMKSELEKLAFSFEDKTKAKEDESRLNEKLEILSKYNLKVDELDFNIDEVSLEDLETKISEFIQSKEISFSATYKQKREALQNSLTPEVVRDASGKLISETYYWISDFSDEYVFVEKTYYTATEYKETNGRFGYIFDDTTLTATINSDFEEMVLVWLTLDENKKLQEERATYQANYDSLKSEFDTYKCEYLTKETEVDELRTYKSTKLAEERTMAETEIFDKFEKLNGNPEFEALKENAKNYEIAALEDKCFSILGKTTANFSVKQKPNTVKVPVETEDTKEDPYGGLFDKYKK